jgi:cell division protein FtsB
MASGHDRLPCQFQLLRYVPDAVRNEYVHIGVVLRTAGPEGESGSEPLGEPASGSGSGGTQMEIRFTRDWRRVRCLDPDADTAMLEGMETELRRRLGEGPDGRLRKILDESLSLNVQMTEPKGYLAESLAAGMEELMRLYVEPPKREKQLRLRGRAAIQGELRRQFERAQVWDLVRKQIRASEYTRPGDPLRIDAGYRPNGVIRMFHAVSLEPGVEMAKVLAFSAAGLKAGVARVEKAELELTAIVEPAARIGATDEEPERLEQYRFAVETMEEHAIRVLTTERLPYVAETARRELRVG